MTAPEGPAIVTWHDGKYLIAIKSVALARFIHKRQANQKKNKINHALSLLSRKAEMCGRMAKVLELARYHVKASVEASHLTDGFGKSEPNGNDFDLAAIDDILAEYGTEGV